MFEAPKHKTHNFCPINVQYGAKQAKITHPYSGFRHSQYFRHLMAKPCHHPPSIIVLCCYVTHFFMVNTLAQLIPPPPTQREVSKSDIATFNNTKAPYWQKLFHYA